MEDAADLTDAAELDAAAVGVTPEAAGAELAPGICDC